MDGQKYLHYTLIHKLGAGGMGVVYKAFDEKLERNVALKFLPTGLLNSDSRQRFELEAKAAAQLDHPNIGVTYSFEVDQDQPIITMALYEGQSLKDYLSPKPLALAEATDFAKQAALALQHAHHKGIIHRDIKPANMFITQDKLLKILDFGLAKAEAFGDLSMPGALLGTPEYMAPEQLRGQQADFKVDLWALGLVFYEMLTGISPFRDEGGITSILLKVISEIPRPVSEIRSELPAQLDLFFEKALAKDPALRFSSAKEFAEALSNLNGMAPAFSVGAATQRADLSITGSSGPLSLRQSPSNLETPESLVGRKDELAIIDLHLHNQDCRILTLLGVGGTGKTTLALNAAYQQWQDTRFPDGVYFVALETHEDVSQIALSLAQVLKLDLQSQKDSTEEIIHSIEQKKILIVLDNFEHIIAGAAVLSQLVKTCPNLTLIVTSRERLGLTEEWLLPITGLPLPEKDLNLETALSYDAVALLVQRAQRAQVGFKLEDKDVAPAIEICQLVHGSPLGIELAAAWVRMMPLTEIATEIKQNLDFLSSSARNVSQRHQSIRAVFEYSWNFLSPEEAAALKALSVFKGGFSKEAAKHVTSATILLLTSLVDKSLLRVSPEGRYDFHPLLSQYAKEKLADDPELGTRVQQEHASYYLTLVKEQASCMAGSKETEALKTIDREHENIRLAKATLGDEYLLEFIWALQTYQLMRGYWQDQLAWIEQGLELVKSQAKLEEEAILLHHLGLIYRKHRDYQQAIETYNQSLALYQELEHEPGKALLHYDLGWAYDHLNRLTEAREHFQLAQELAEELDDERLIAQTDHGLGLVDADEGFHDEGCGRLEESHDIFEELEDRHGQARVLTDLAYIYHLMEDPDQVIGTFQEALLIFEDLGDVSWQCVINNNLGHIHAERQDYGTAVKFYETLKSIAEENHLQRFLCAAYTALADLHLKLEDLDSAQSYGQKANRESKKLNPGIEQGESARVLGDVWLALDKPARAKRSFEKALTVLQDLGEEEELNKAKQGHERALRLA